MFKLSKVDLFLVTSTVFVGSASFLTTGLSVTLGFTTAGIVLGGLVVSKTARQKVFGNIKQDWIAGELDFDRLDVDQQTVHMKVKGKGKKRTGLFRVIEIAGLSYDTKVMDEQDNLLTIRAGLFKSLVGLGVSMRLFGIKRRVDVSYSADYPSDVLQEIGNKERSLFSETYNLRWILIIESDSLHRLDKACQNITSTMRVYNANVLEGTQVYSVLNYLLTGEWLAPEHIELRDNVSAALPSSDLILDYNTGFLHTSTPKNKVSRILSIQAWPGSMSGQFMAELMAIIGDIEFHQILLPQTDLQVKARIGTEQRGEGAFSAMFFNSEKAAEQSQIIDLLNSDSMAMVTTQTGIIYRAESELELSTLEQRIYDVLNKWMIKSSVDKNCAGHYWFNRLPFKNSLVRELHLNTINVAGLWALHNSPSGQYVSPWGDKPLRLFKTPVGQNYAFNLHNSSENEALGHSLIVAPSGGGKSTLMSHILGGLSKFDIPSVIFDSHEGMRFMVEAMGGGYSNIGSLALNPFDCELTKEKGLHLLRLLRSMGEISDDEVQLVLEQAFHPGIERNERSLNMIHETAFNEDTQKSFAPWVEDAKGNVGMYSHIFNAPKDSLSNIFAQSFMTGIDLGEVLSDPVLAAPIVMHITDALKTMSTQKKGFCVFIDEAAALLKNDIFKKNVAIMYREYRKLGGSVCLAFQDPKALFDSGEADAILDNTATIILLPNSQGSPEAYKRFGLNDEQLNYILTGSALSQKRTALVIKRDSKGFEESVIIDIDLSPYGQDIIKYYQSGSRALKSLKILQQQWGEQWHNHIK